MRFLKKINQEKFALLIIFLFLYAILNLFDGERGLISYYKKKEIIKSLFEKKESLEIKLSSIEKENSLLTDIIDLDYLETLYRIKFMVGKSDEKIFIK